jgi:hypothetical protein
LYQYLYTGGEVNFYFTGTTFILNVLAKSHIISEFYSKIRGIINYLYHPDLISPLMLQKGLREMEERIAWDEFVTSPMQAEHSLDCLLNFTTISYDSNYLKHEVPKMIKAMTAHEVSEFFTKYVLNSKMDILLVGNLTPERAMKIASNFKTFWFERDFKYSDKKFQSFNQFDQTWKLYEDFLFQFRSNRKHYMLRSEDLDKKASASTYLTYFFMGTIDRLTHLMIRVFVRQLTKYFQTFFLEKGFKKVKWQIDSKREHVNLGITLKTSHFKLKPIEMEVHVDEGLRKFILDVLPSMSSSELREDVEDTLVADVEYEDDLMDVVKKQIESLWFKQMTKKYIGSYVAADMINTDMYAKFFHEKMVENQKRITIEKFPKLTEEQKEFKNEKALMLGDLEYKLVDEQKFLIKIYNALEKKHD